MAQAPVRGVRGAAKGVRALSTGPEQRPLPWESCAYVLTDLRLRHQRRMAGVFASVPTTLLAGAGAGSYFMTQEIDPSQTVMGVRCC